MWIERERTSSSFSFGIFSFSNDYRALVVLWLRIIPDYLMPSLDLLVHNRAAQHNLIQLMSIASRRRITLQILGNLALVGQYRNNNKFIIIAFYLRKV